MKKYILLLILSSIGVMAQESALKKAEQKFDSQDYISAIKIYESLAQKGTGSDQIYEKLGDANYFNANYIQAEKWYSKRYLMGGQFPKEFLYRYGQTLKSSGREKEAKLILAQYAKENPTEIRVLNQLNDKNIAQKTILEGSDKFSISNLSINSKYSDYSSTIIGDSLLFASARPRSAASPIYNRTGQPFTNLYYSRKKANGSYDDAKLYSKETFSVYHESSPVFSPDGNAMYYTQNEVKANTNNKLVNGSYKIYKSIKQKGKWKNLGVQSIFALGETRVAHPAISPDGSTLYFASDGNGTFGQSDLFKVTINSDGTYSTPENLGKNVNTEGRESYPFVTKDNILVFASDGHSGLGGFDVYALDLKQPGTSPVHLPDPINSHFDDFGLFWSRDNNSGVFTSNRIGGKGDDDLYEFKNISDVPFAFNYDAKMTGKVIDKVTEKPIPGVIVLLLKDGKEVDRTTTNEMGNFVFDKIQPNVSYRTQTIKNDIYADNESITTLPLYQDSIETIIKLDQDKFKIEKGLDLAKALALRHIYFDFGKWDIREDAKIELDKIVEALVQNPKIRIQIGSFTDSRNSKPFNQKLSDLRANSTKSYLIEKGINPNRLQAKGYGETRLVNKCSDGVQCTEEEHELNRRSSFVIISK